MPKEAKDLTLLQKLEQSARNRNLEKHSKKSLEWFRKNASKVAGKKEAQSLLLKQQKEVHGSLRTQPKIGRMFVYAYDAKHKDTLPYWDKFPLIFLIGKAKNGFLGLNLHYLSPKYRAILFDALLSIVNNTSITEKRKLNLTYKLLKNTQEFSLFSPCIKHYLTNHLVSRAVEIAYNEWEDAIFLPIADFTGASNSKVWSDSILKVNGKKKRK
jgi:hypothetical protein